MSHRNQQICIIIQNIVACPSIFYFIGVVLNMLTFCCGETLINCARTINLFSHRVQSFANTALCFAAKVNLEPMQICRHSFADSVGSWAHL